jgi:hypothetical protein
VLDNAIYAPQFFTFVKLAMQMSSDLYMTQHLYKSDYYANFDRLKSLNLEIGWKVMFNFLSRYSENNMLS